jgi:membrane dipeptidase
MMRLGDRIVPVVDTHADSLSTLLEGQRHLGEWGSTGQLDWPRMVEGGSNLQFLSCWVEPEYKPERALGQLLRFLDKFWLEVEAYPAQVQVVTDLARLNALVESDGVGAVLSIEGSEALGTDLGRLRLCYRMGVRLVSLTWNERNALADGAGEDPGGGGVSRDGRAMIAEMNRIGMIIDVSHLAEAGFWDVLELSKDPVIASHSNCRAVTAHVRNLSNGQIRALAKANGVQGITFVREFLGGSEDVDRVIDHMMHSLAVVGDDRHLGLGSDFDGVDHPVSGLEDVTALPRLAERMAVRGLADDTIAHILGGNYIEFLRRAWDRPTPLTRYL